MKRQFSRQQLYELVWSQPMRTVAATMGISDVALAKTCRKANIPVPPRGFWARKQAGRTVAKPPLALRFPGASDMVGNERPSYGWNENWRERILAEPIPPIPIFEEDESALTRRVRALVGKVESQTAFQNPHSLVARLLVQDEDRKVDYAKYKSNYYAPKYDAGIGRRRLLILNSLFLAFQRLGCGVSMTTSQYADDSRQISVCVGQQRIGFTLDPITSKKNGIVNNDRLRLSLGKRRSSAEPQAWEDGHRVLLERKLTEIVVAVLVAAEMDHHGLRAVAVTRVNGYSIERKAEIEKELIKIKAEDLRKAEEARERQRSERIARLIEQAAQLDRSNQIRAYVQAVRNLSSSIDVTSDQLMSWANWALSEADQIDPSKNGAIAKAITEREAS